RWDVHYNWGLRHCDIDLDALKNFRFVVNRLHLRLRDGTLVRVPEDGPVAALDLRPLLESEPAVTVSLGVPSLLLGRANTGPGAENRFRGEMVTLEDENTGQNGRPVPLRRLNFKLTAAAGEQAGYELLPVARVQKSGQAGALPELSGEYIPPLLARDAWPGLRGAILDEVSDRGGARAKRLATAVRNH